MRNVKNSAGFMDVIRRLSVPRLPSPAFTLIELMVVIAVIGILIAGVFRLVSAAGTGNKKAETIARLERVQNALSGFYAEFGTYPPVPQHGSPDPYVEEAGRGGLRGTTGTGGIDAALRIVRCQPVGESRPVPGIQA
ncbi:MAG: type II secretion system protein [Syntrophales bacterium]